MEEVRFHRLRPDQIRQRREACPVVYIPLGTLEWHGLHNPMGADGLQAEHLAIRCAQKGGGLAFPTVYFGEPRAGSLLETDPKLYRGVAQRMGLKAEGFEETRQPQYNYEQIRAYQDLLVHILAEAHSYGFKMAVFVIGHYPLLDHARAAVMTYEQWQYDKCWEDKLSAWAFADYYLLKGQYENPGDHAGGWETSHLLASDPETVDLQLAEKTLQYGIMSTRDPSFSSAEFGEEIYEKAVDEALKEVQKRMENFDYYLGHGASF